MGFSTVNICKVSRDGAHVFNPEGVCGYCGVKGKISSRNDVKLQDAIDEAKKPQAADMVNAPPHYNQAGIECIDAIAAATSGKTGVQAVCVANVIKYLWRYELKNGVEDVKKARWYLDRLIGELDK
jgi:uncharacterized protein DUF3310